MLINFVTQLLEEWVGVELNRTMGLVCEINLGPVYMEVGDPR